MTIKKHSEESTHKKSLLVLYLMQYINWFLKHVLSAAQRLNEKDKKFRNTLMSTDKKFQNTLISTQSKLTDSQFSYWGSFVSLF